MASRIRSSLNSSSLATISPGTVKSLGYSLDITGKATGNHFELFAEWDKKKPFVTGELVNGELHAIAWGKDKMVAKPATAADQIPTVKFIPPPALHKVPYNGLAKTPPMGWNSWNKFADQVDDQTVREMADAMVAAACATPATSTSTSTTPGKAPRDANGNITTNNKFPDMKALADYVHSQGPEARHLLLARPARPAPAISAATGTKSRTRRPTPPGASTT